MLRNVHEACGDQASSFNSATRGRRTVASCSSLRRRARAASRMAMALAMGAVLAEVSPWAQAASASWTGVNNSDWNNAANWSGGVFPVGLGTLGLATVNLSTGNFPILTANSAFLPSDIIIGDGTGLSGRLDARAGSLNTGTGNFLYVGRNSGTLAAAAGTGILNIADTSVAGGGITGFGLGSASLTIGNGTGGRLAIGVGTSAIGTVNINTTGTVTVLDAQGVRIGDVIGAGTLAGGGTAVLNMENGILNCTGGASEFWVGASTFSTGTMNMTGGTVTSNSWFVVGRDTASKGVLNLSGGTINAAMTGGNITISSFTNTTAAQGTINVTGGLLNTANGLIVGEGGLGTLNLSGGTINIQGAGGMLLGSGATGQGTANLNGGTLNLQRFQQGTDPAGATINFNGTYVRALANVGNFMNADITRSNIRNAGMVIDTNGFNITLNEEQQHSDVGGDNAVDGGITKSGAGSMTLNGVNTYTGPTTINGGALGVGTAGSVNTTSGITVNGGGRFFSNSSIAVTPTVNVNSGSIAGTGGSINTVNFASAAGNSVIANNAGSLTVGALTFAGTGQFDLTVAGTTPAVNTNTLTANGGAGSISVNATAISWEPGTYNLIGYTTLGGTSGGFAGFQKGTIGNLSPRQSSTLINTGSSIALSVVGENPRWTGAASSDWTTATVPPPKNWILPVAATTTDYLQGDVVLFDDNASNTTVNITEPSGTVSPLLTQFNNTTTNYVLNGPGALGGTGGLNKDGTGILTINSANTYSGPTNFNNGQLNLNNNTALGTGTLNITAGANTRTFDNTSGSAKTLANPQNWNADFTVAGTNTLTFSGAINRTGAQALTINGANPFGVSGAINGTGSLTKLGTGTLVLSGTNTYDARVLVRAGVLSVTAGNSGPAAARNSENANMEIAPVSGDTGTVILSGGTLNVDRMIVGGNSGNSDGGFGNFIMTGGVLNANRWFATASQTSGQTTFSGGTINCMNTGGGTQQEVAALGSGTGVFNMSGGTLKEWNNNSIAIGGFNNTGAATLNQTGGTINFYSNTTGTTIGGNGNVIIGQSNCTGNYTFNFGNGTANSATLSTGAVVRNTVLQAVGNSSTFNWNGGHFIGTRNNAFAVENVPTVNVGGGGAIFECGTTSFMRMPEPLRHDASGPATDGGLTKAGIGTLRLTAPMSYTGPTVISAGTLQLSTATPTATAVGAYSFEDFSQGTVMGTGSVILNSGTGGATMNGAVNDANHLLGGGGASIVAGKFGNGLAFDGLGSSVDVANQIVSQAGTASWTLNLWVNTSTAGSAMMSKNNGTVAWDGQDSVYYMGGKPIAAGGGGLPTAVRNGGGFVQGNQLAADGSWHMVTYVNDEGYNGMYVDGVLVANNFSAFGTGDNSVSVRLGYNIDTATGDGVVNYNGIMDELKLYNGALNAAQVSQLFSTNTVTAPGGNVYIPPTSPVSLTASGAALDLNGNAATFASITGVAGTTIQLGAGTLFANANNSSTTYDGTIIGTGSVVKIGTGQLTLTANNTYTGNTVVNAGTLLFSTKIAPSAVNVTAGTLRVAAKGTPNSAAGTSVIKSLAISGSGVVDLTNNSMVIDYTGAVGTQVGDLRGHLRNGRLVTTAVTPANTRLGYVDNNTLGTPKTSFGGVSVDATSILVKFTYAGDGDLDGDADGVDIGTWATNFTGELGGGATATRVWSQGDWDYDGDVDGVDAGLWATAFTGELGGGGLSSVVVTDFTINPQAASILQGMGITVVPEPASVGLLAGFGAMALSRRSRRRR